MAIAADAHTALAFVRQQAAGGRATYTEKAIQEFRSFAAELGTDDIRACLRGVREEEVVSYEPDHTRPDRMVLKLKALVSGRACYCKVALRPGWDRTVAVLSFKAWRGS